MREYVAMKDEFPNLHLVLEWYHHERLARGYQIVVSVQLCWRNRDCVVPKVDVFHGAVDAEIRDLA